MPKNGIISLSKNGEQGSPERSKKHGEHRQMKPHANCFQISVVAKMLELLFSLFNIHRNPHACWLTSQCFPQTCNSPWSTVKVLRVFKLQPPNFLSQSRNTSLNHPLKKSKSQTFFRFYQFYINSIPFFGAFHWVVPQARWMVDFMISWKIRQWMIWGYPHMPGRCSRDALLNHLLSFRCHALQEHRDVRVQGFLLS